MVHICAEEVRKSVIDQDEGRGTYRVHAYTSDEYRGACRDIDS